MDGGGLSEVMGGRLSRARYDALAPAYNRAMLAAGCTTIKRAAQWHAQIGHESGGLYYMGEAWGPTDQQKKYGRIGGDLARQLGNVKTSDGYDYRGAGPIQITGRGNFAKVSAWGHAHGLCPTPTYFVDHPDELRSERYGFVGAIWYWTVARPRINAMADAGDIVSVTKAINGGTTGLADRQARYDRVRRLGERILPSPDGPVARPIEPVRKRIIPVPEEAIEPMLLRATPVPPNFDPNGDPRTWPEVATLVPFDQAGGWLGDCAVAIAFDEVPGRTRDKIAGFVSLASWVFDPPAGGSDVRYVPVDTRLTAQGGGAPLVRHWATPPYVAPKGARGMVINYRAPAGGTATIGRNPAPR